jgi:hypothetical protein
MSQKIHHFEEQLVTDKEKMETSTWCGANTVASFEEHNIDLESIVKFKVSISNKIGDKSTFYTLKLYSKFMSCINKICLLKIKITILPCITMIK